MQDVRARALRESTGWRSVLDRPRLSAAALPALAVHIALDLPPVHDVTELDAAPAIPTGNVPDTVVACALKGLRLISFDATGDGSWMR
ncbi:MAG: hypothetical protein OXJ64_19070 [Boseongicola sp.]|nr:hypothetical protein [Boseongicola sp.]